MASEPEPTNREPYRWPDPLHPPDAASVASMIPRFWHTLDRLPDLMQRQEFILAEQLTSTLRDTVIEMMLAMNGLARPVDTQHLNLYLGTSQRAVLEKTLIAPTSGAETWMARAVALTVIQSWYAPQLAERYGVAIPDDLIHSVRKHLADALPDWPLEITTDPPPAEPSHVAGPQTGRLDNPPEAEDPG